MKTRSLTLLLATAATPAALFAAVAAGGTVYTKRAETKLLVEPKPLADAATKLPPGRALKIEEVRGLWLRVKEGQSSGWVFAGNIAEEKPAEVQGLDGLPVAASETTATAAARPLVPAAEEYSARHDLGNASEDLKWLTEQRAKITPADVKAFLQEKKTGEFQ